MKINIPKPCKQKLSTTNFCSQCQHLIPDLSACTSSELVAQLEQEKIHCAIFSSSQMNRNIDMKPILNVVMVSSFGLIPSSTQAQLSINEADNLFAIEQNISTHKIRFTIQLNEEEKEILESKETFRVLINDQLILDTLEFNKTYQIEFETNNQTEIILRVASNQHHLEIQRLYHQYKFPKEIKLKRTDLSVRRLIMGKIAYPIDIKLNKEDQK